MKPSLFAKSALRQLLMVFVLAGLISGCSSVDTKPLSSTHQTSDEVSRLLQLPHLQDYIDKEKKRITSLLAKGDEASVKGILQSDRACLEVMLFVSLRMKTPKLYTKRDDGRCVKIGKMDNASNYAVDAQCNQPISYAPPSQKRFCAEILDKKEGPRLGDAGSWQPNDTPIAGDPTRKWTLNNGTRLYLTSLPLSDNTQPFMKRVRYKKIGQCQLEMRIYSKNPTAKGLKPLIAIHGGNWKFRGGAFIGLESEISHYTDRGYIVFAPFYRLVGDAYDLTDCQNAAWKKITDDAESALDWVKANGEAVGADPNARVVVFGQSAGAHLSGWLLSHRQSEIEAAMLYYPPTDFEKFAKQAKPGGEYANYMASLTKLRAFLGMKDGEPYNQEALRLNTFPLFVNENSPPVFILHGDKDVVVPADQSQMVCNAYNPNDATLDAPATSLINYLDADNFHCGAKGTLTRLHKANHALDIRCLPTLPCPAGGLIGISDVREGMKRGYKWLDGLDH